MRAGRFRFGRGGTKGHEWTCLLLLLALLAGWFGVVLVTMPKTAVQTINASWGQHINHTYTRLVDGLNYYVGTQVVNGWSGVSNLVVLPVTGSALERYNFCSPRDDGVAAFLRISEDLETPASWSREKQIVAAGTLQTGDLGIRLNIAEFVGRVPERPEEFRVAVEASVERADGTRAPLLEVKAFQGSNAMLPWFVQNLPTRAIGLAWMIASITFIFTGLVLGYIYYRLVTGTFVGPRWLAVPINTVRAATGLIASSLLFLTGFVSLLLIFFLAPTSGETLNPSRLHVDLLLETSEPVYPSVEIGRPDNMLHVVGRQLAEAMVDGLARDIEKVKDKKDDRFQPGELNDFLPWIHEGLPEVLRARITEIEFTGGATWQVFGMSGGETVKAFDGMQWLPASRQDRKEAIDSVFEKSKSKIMDRSTEIPMPWDEEKISQLDEKTMTMLRAGSGGPESLRFARILFSSFHYLSPGHLQHWLKEAESKGADERIYGVVLPSLPRSSYRYWESLEGNLLGARAVADRVAILHELDRGLNGHDSRLVALAGGKSPHIIPDIALPVFPSGGIPLERFEEFDAPRDLEQMRAALFLSPAGLTDQARRLAADFKRWFFGSSKEIEEMLVFTIPRSPIYFLTIILGLIFILAGLRTEQNAQGLGPFTPPVVLLISTLVWPIVAAGWVFSRADTSRFVIFGYADLAFWGVCYFWFCLVVVPLFGGRVRVGLRRDGWMWLTMTLAIALATCIPLMTGSLRIKLAQGCLIAVTVGGIFTFLIRRILRHRFDSMDVTLILFVFVAWVYKRMWRWESQDVPALLLASLFLVMVVSGWRRGFGWWFIDRRPFYDRISWLQPFNRLMLGMLLTLAGAAVLYCSFPVTDMDGWIRGYNSYCMFLCVLPFLLCAMALVLVDLTQRQIT